MTVDLVDAVAWRHAVDVCERDTSEAAAPQEDQWNSTDVRQTAEAERASGAERFVDVEPDQCVTVRSFRLTDDVLKIGLNAHD